MTRRNLCAEHAREFTQREHERALTSVELHRYPVAMRVDSARRVVAVVIPTIFSLVCCGDGGTVSPRASSEALGGDVLLSHTWMVSGSAGADDEYVDTRPPALMWKQMENDGRSGDGRLFMMSTGARVDAAGGTEHRFQELRLVPVAVGSPVGQKASGVIAPPAEKAAGVHPVLLAAMINMAPSDLVDVYVDLRIEPSTPLGPHPASLFHWSADSTASVGAAPDRLLARKSEVTALTKGVRQHLEAAGASYIEEFWLTGNVLTRIRVKDVAALAARDDVRALYRPPPSPPASSTTWDGTDIRHASGVNTGVFISAGYDGQYVNPRHGGLLRLAVLDDNFDPDHPGFADWTGGPSRVISTWNCLNAPACTAGAPFPPSGTHGTVVAGIAAGDLTQGQMGGTADWQLDRSGAAKEVELVLMEVGSGGSTERALQKAVELAVDAVSLSRGGLDSCDGNFAGVDEAVYQAYQAGVHVSISAGNAGHPGGCTLWGHADNLSGFVVGALGESQSGVTYANYSTSNVWSSSSEGGIDVTTSGALHSRAVTAVSAMAPLGVQYGYMYDNTFEVPTGWGTSLAQPQVVGAGLLVKHFMLANLGLQINERGALFSALLAMTDRATGQFAYGSSGFSPFWGGGRFQARLFTTADHPSGGWGWSQHNVRLRQGDWVNISVQGPGIEPIWLNQFKVHAVFMEPDAQDIGDIDVYVRDQDCGAGSQVLGYDQSYDTKSMVRLAGWQAGGKALCVQLHGYYIPTGQTRYVHIFTYYSADVQMR